ELAEVAERRTGVVVDQDVRLRARREQRLLAVRARDVAGDRGDLRPGRLADLFGDRLEPLAIEPVEHDLAARLGEALRAGPTEPAARSADDGLAAGDAEIHGRLLWERPSRRVGWRRAANFFGCARPPCQRPFRSRSGRAGRALR